MQQIAQGAEAVLFKETKHDKTKIIKERLSKSYRLPQIDEALRKFRTKREAKVLSKLQEMNFPAPRLHEFCDKRMSIFMDFVPGEKLKNVLMQELEDVEDCQQLPSFAKEIGQKIGRLHSNNIIHGDLTTSNIIKHQQTGELTFIDFGLSSFSEKVEDKAVDLFLLNRALESTHYELYPDFFEKAIEGYKEAYPEAAAVLERFEQVKRRGRNKKR